MMVCGSKNTSHKGYANARAGRYSDRARSRYIPIRTDIEPEFSMNAGRNDPCPCGSGKKYKRCCLLKPADPIDILWSHERKASESLTEQMLRFATRRFGAFAQDAWDDFNLGYPEEQFASAKSEGQIFNPYFIFHWTLKRTRTSRAKGGDVARAFLLENSTRLDEMELQVLELSMAEPLSFYEVVSNRPGAGFLLRDILTGRETDVREQSASSGVQSGNIIFGQVLALQGLAVLGCCASVVIPPRMKAEVVALRKRLRNKCRKQNGEIKGETLSRYAEEIRATYLQIRTTLYAPPRFCNTDGDPILFCTLTFAIDSPEAAFKALAPLALGRSKDELLEDAEFDDFKGLQKVEFEWIKRGNRKIKTWDNTILGRICIHGRTLVAQVNSAKRATRVRNEIEKRIGVRVVYQNTVTQTYEELQRNAKGRDGAADKRADMEHARLMQEPEVRKQLQEAVQKQLESWVHQKIPALGGRTPLEAIKDPDGREIVEALLLDFERKESRANPDVILPDVSALRRILNLRR